MQDAQLIEAGTLALRVSPGPSDHVIAARGELDVSNAGALERELRAALAGDSERVVLDLVALEFIDSTGLRTLLIAERISAADSSRLVLRRPSGQVARVLALTGIGDELKFLD